jgi:hypothetical protein
MSEEKIEAFAIRVALGNNGAAGPNITPRTRKNTGAILSVTW